MTKILVPFSIPFSIPFHCIDSAVLDYLFGPQSEITVITVKKEFNSYLAEMEPPQKNLTKYSIKDFLY